MNNTVNKLNLEKSLLILDDDDVFRNRLITAMKRKGYEAYGAASVQEAKSLLSEKFPKYAVIDIALETISGSKSSELFSIKPLNIFLESWILESSSTRILSALRDMASDWISLIDLFFIWNSSSKEFSKMVFITLCNWVLFFIILFKVEKHEYNNVKISGSVSFENLDENSI